MQRIDRNKNEFTEEKRTKIHDIEKAEIRARNGPPSSQTAVKSQNLEKRAFSLPCISHNMHYTKFIQSKTGPPSSVFLDSGGPAAVQNRFSSL